MPAGMNQRRYIAPDGTPQYVIWAEQWLVGGALLAPAKDIPVSGVEPDEFHDSTLATIWAAVIELAAAGTDPTVILVARLLEQWGDLDRIGSEERLADICTSEQAMVYSGAATMSAHAALVQEQGKRRKRISELSEEVRAISEGKVIPSAHRFRGGVSMDFVEVSQ